MYRKIFTTFLFAALLFLNADATHYMGVDVSYECIGACTYRIWHYSYYDCTGGATTPLPGPPPAPSITFSGLPFGCGPQPATIGSAWTFVSYTEVTPICPGATTGCTSGSSSINGVLQAIFYRDYNMCNTNCTSFTIEWENCCRNYAITSGASGDGIHTETVIDLTQVPCNSSPQFTNVPVPYICAGQCFTFNQGAFDPDGDSLVYSLGLCYDGANVPVGYSGGLGYSPAQPLGSSWNVQLNPLTGDINMCPNPNPGGGNIVVGVMCIYVDEYRNGTWIGQVVRDMQITVLPCNFTNPNIGGIQNVMVGGIGTIPLAANSVGTCAGVEVCFEIPSVNPSPTAIYTMSWDQSIFGASFVDLNNPSVQNILIGNQPVAQFCWTPPAPGLYSFLLTITDDNCPIQGLYQSTVLIYVGDGLAGSNATFNYVGCNEVQFVALPNQALIGNFTYNWTGNGNLDINPNNQDSILTHFYPAPGIYNYQVVIRDTFGCESTISGIVNLTTGVTADAGPDLALCSGYNFGLGSAPISGQSYSWAPATGLSNPNIANPTFTLSNTGAAPVNLNYVLTVTDGTCTTYDYSTVQVYPVPAVNISPTAPVICFGDTITLTAAGGNGYQWSSGETTASIQVSPTVTTTYSVVTFDNGCTSVPVYETVGVTIPPVGQIAGTFRVCPGDNSTLSAVGGNGHLWSNGSTGTSITLSNITTPQSVWMIPDNNGCEGDTVFANVTLYDEPTADFDATVVCAGEPTVFSDLSSITGGTVASWSWNFGNPASGSFNVSNQQAPTHVFTQPGNFTVQLTVLSDQGCQDVITKNITVKPIPKADFTFLNICDGSNMQFTNQSTIAPGSAIVSYLWDFGDGNTAATQNATHTYGDFGYFNVTLTVVSDNGCEDSYAQTVFVHPIPVSDFIVGSICEDFALPFTSTATVSGPLDHVNGWLWNFGDPGSGPSNLSSQVNPSHTYSNPGNYTVTLTVTSSNGCTHTTQKDVTIYAKPVSKFTYEKVCANERTEFTDKSLTDPATPIVSWSWDFGDGKTSTTRNPKHDYAPVGPGTYTVSLTVVTNVGCEHTLQKVITINPVPSVNFFSTAVCFGETTEFTDQSAISTGGLWSWSWDFGDNVGNSTVPNPTYTYNAPGDYRANLTVVSDSGCINNKVRTVIVHPPSPAPEIRNDTVCFGDPAFLNASISQDVTVFWYDTPGASNQPFHSGYSYVTPPLPFTTTYYVVTETDKGCRSIPYPVTGFVFSEEAVEIVTNKDIVDLPLGVVNFSTISTIPIQSWSWNFDDGNTSDLPQPIHEFENPGIYNVVVRTTDMNGCVVTIEKVIEVKRLVTLSIPSAFSPNDDGINDVFEIGHWNVERFNMQVFNRWGQMVYETNSIAFKWDGTSSTSGTPVPEGVYVYVIEAITFDNKQVKQNGTITLIR